MIEFALWSRKIEPDTNENWQGHKRAMMSAVVEGVQGIEVSLYKFQDWHEWLFPAGFGRLRTLEVFTKNHDGSMANFAYPHEIRGRLADILSYAYTHTKWYDIAKAHAELRLIQPFPDGNKRLARIFLIWHIHHAGHAMVGNMDYLQYSRRLEAIQNIYTDTSEIKQLADYLKKHQGR